MTLKLFHGESYRMRNGQKVTLEYDEDWGIFEGKPDGYFYGANGTEECLMITPHKGENPFDIVGEWDD